MIEAPETFVFLCPICHERSEHERGQERKRSHCPHCHSAVVLLDLNGSSERSASVGSSERDGSFRDLYPGLAWLGQLVVEIVFLPLTLLAWLISLLLTPISYPLRRARATYRSEGWRGVSRFRLSHFLIACTVIAALAGFVGRYFVRQWETQKRAEEFYEAQLALRSQRAAVEAAANAVAGRVHWNIPDIPSEFYGTDQVRNLYSLDSGANVNFHDSLPRSTGLPPPDECREHLETIVSYPALKTIDAYETKLNGSYFEDLPGSASLKACSASPPLATLEFYRWCGRCPNLERIHIFVFGSAGDFVVDDACLEALSQSPSLESLHLESVRVSARGVAALGRLKTLQYLSLELARPLGPDEMAQIAHLTLPSLSLKGPPHSDQSVEELCNASTLRSLDVADGTFSERQVALLQRALPSTRIRVEDGP